MVKNKPIFSVVMPAYNAERYVGEAARAACLAKRDLDPAGRLLGLLYEAAKQSGYKNFTIRERGS